MSRPDRLCPEPDIGCDACIRDFMDAHPGAELFESTYHWCDCLWIADTGEVDVCVGCGEKRDLWAEFDHLLAGWPKRAA